MTKKVFSILFALVLMVSFSLIPAALVGASPGPGLVGEWHFDEGSGTTASDSSGYGNHGIIPPTSGATWIADGISGSALNFDGWFDWVSFGTGVTSQINSQDPRDYTVAAWIRPSSLPRGRNAAMSFTAMEFGQTSGRVWFRQAYGGWPSGYSIMSGPVLEIGKWTHIVGVFHEDVGIDLYVDGNYIGSDNTKTGLDGNATIYGPTHAGVWYVNPDPFGGAWFDGDIDEIYIYNHALSAEKIAALASPISVIEVDIDIKPGSDPNSLNLNGNGVVPVGVFGTDTFHVNDINVSTVRFGVDGDEAEAIHSGHIEYLNDDDIPDMVLHFREGELGIPVDTPGNTTLDLLLTGELNDSTAFEGTDVVRITPNNDKSRGKGGKGPK